MIKMKASYLRNLFAKLREPELFRQLRSRSIKEFDEHSLHLARELVEDAFRIPTEIRNRLTEKDRLEDLYEAVAGKFWDHGELELLQINLEEVVGDIAGGEATAIMTIADIAKLIAKSENKFKE